MSTFWKPTPPEITPSSFTSPVSKTTNRNPFEITSEWIHKRRDLSFEDKFSPIVQLWIKQDNELPIARTDNNQIIKDFVQLLKNIPLEIQFEIISFIPTLTMRRHISLLKTKEKFKEMTENTISTIRSNRKLNLLFENPLSSLEEEQLNYEKDILFIYQEDSLLYSFLKNRIICKEFKRKFEHLIAQNFINNGLNLTFLIKEDVFGYPYKEVDGRYKFAFCLIRYLNNLSNAEQSIKSTENVTEIFNENFVKEFDNIFSPKFNFFPNDQFLEHKGKIDPFLTGCIKQIKKEEKNEKKEIPKKEKKSSEGFQFTFANKEDSNTSSNNTTLSQQPLMTESKSSNNFNFSKTTHKEDSKSDTTTTSSGATTGIFNFKFDIKESSEKIENNSGNLLFNLPNIASNSNTQFNFENTKKVRKVKKNNDKNKNPICLNPNIKFDNYAPNVINDSKITLKEEINKIIDNYNENLNNIPEKIEDDFIQRFKNQFIIPQLQSNTFDETLKKILSKQKDDSNLFNLSESTNYKKEFKSVERDYSKVLDYLIEKSIHLTNIKKLILHKRNCFNREISLLLTLLPNLEHLTFVELSFISIYNNVTHPKLLKLECINVHTIFSNKEEVKLKLRKLFPSLFCLILHFNSMKKVLFPVLFKSSFGKLDNLFQLEYCDFNDKMIIEKKKDDIFVFLSSLQNHLENNNLKQFVNDYNFNLLALNSSFIWNFISTDNEKGQLTNVLSLQKKLIYFLFKEKIPIQFIWNYFPKEYKNIKKREMNNFLLEYTIYLTNKYHYGLFMELNKRNNLEYKGQRDFILQIILFGWKEKLFNCSLDKRKYGIDQMLRICLMHEDLFIEMIDWLRKELFINDDNFILFNYFQFYLLIKQCLKLENDKLLFELLKFSKNVDNLSEIFKIKSDTENEIIFTMFSRLKYKSDGKCSISALIKLIEIAPTFIYKSFEENNYGDNILHYVIKLIYRNSNDNVSNLIILKKLLDAIEKRGEAKYILQTLNVFKVTPLQLCCASYNNTLLLFIKKLVKTAKRVMDEQEYLDWINLKDLKGRTAVEMLEMKENDDPMVIKELISLLKN